MSTTRGLVALVSGMGAFEAAAGAVRAGAVGTSAGETGFTGSGTRTDVPDMIFLIASRADLERRGLHRSGWAQRPGTDGIALAD
jgi:hypothetical protein